MAVPPETFGDAGDDIPIGIDLMNVLKPESALNDVVDFTVPLNVTMPFQSRISLEFPNTANVKRENISNYCLAFHNGFMFECASELTIDDNGHLAGTTSHFTPFTVMPRDDLQHVDASNPVPEHVRNRIRNSAAPHTKPFSFSLFILPIIAAITVLLF